LAAALSTAPRSTRSSSSDEVLRDQVIERTSASVIKQAAVQRGHLQTLRMDGSKKVLMGRTTIEEVFRVTQLDVF
jgi:type II secretory ATPase GspE/PulE/Tfp pilus assembly ATPase PilB-like protein